jgi:hypothetical protein
VQLKFGGSVNLLTPGRLFVRGISHIIVIHSLIHLILIVPIMQCVIDGALKKVFNSQGIHWKKHQKYYFALFNDCLIYAKVGKSINLLLL